ncbi:hypothetical protein Q5P01_018334 [Channa striata]|uniref:Uncharacterized protein n=1 Tax=Channa striata TaxID=64152 RepID=A0AA88M6F0_CHASR|nr:hypothetical protein Q5P01_018334 [Channa striata]
MVLSNCCILHSANGKAASRLAELRAEQTEVSSSASRSSRNVRRLKRGSQIRVCGSATDPQHAALRFSRRAELHPEAATHGGSGSVLRSRGQPD